MSATASGEYELPHDAATRNSYARAFAAAAAIALAVALDLCLVFLAFEAVGHTFRQAPLAQPCCGAPGVVLPPARAVEHGVGNRLRARAQPAPGHEG